jgi:hypothetical protein
MRTLSVRSLLILPFVVGLYACAQWQAGNPSSPSIASVGQNGAQAGNSTPLFAVVKFGRPDTGSPFPPVPRHDHSANAKDNLTPRDVVIDVNGSVRFEIPPDVHQLAIYDDGKEPGDVNTNILIAGPAGCPPVPLINDPVMRLAVNTGPCFTPRTYTRQFSDPGRFLVICTFRPHFLDDMYGWVTVRGRDE